MEYKKFEQMTFLGYLLLHYIDQGKYISIDEICQHLDDGDVVEFIFNKFGMDNNNFNVNNLRDANNVLKRKYVSKSKAKEQGIDKNGLNYLMWLILEDVTRLLYEIDMDDDNNIKVETYRAE